MVAQHQHSKGSFLWDPKLGFLQVHDFAPDREVDKWYQAALTIEGKIANWDVIYSGGYLQRSLDLQADYSYYTVYYDNIPGVTLFPDGKGGFLDPTQYFHNHQAITKQTHEFRISSPAHERLRFTAGMFMQRQADRNVADYYVPGAGSIPNSPAVSGDDLFLTRTHIVDRDYAAFGQLAYDITPSLTLTGGIRGFIAHNTLKGFSGFQSTALRAGCQVPIALSCISVDKKVDESGETHKATLQWQIDPDRMVYATYSTGFRPGGNNRGATIQPYTADTLDNYEVGFKTNWLDRTLRINGAFYYETWNKLQYALAPVGDAGVKNIYNAGDARVYGVEADFSWFLFHHLTLSGSGAYNDAKLTTDFCDIGPSGNPLPSCSVAAGNIAAPKGTRLPVQPRFKGTATVRYDFDLGAIKPFLQGGMLHQSGTRSYLGILEGSLLGDTPSFTTFDFSAGGRLGSFSIEVFIQNAFDSHGQLSRNSVCVPVYCGQYGRILPVKPQLFGVKLAQRF